MPILQHYFTRIGTGWETTGRSSGLKDSLVDSLIKRGRYNFPQDSDNGNHRPPVKLSYSHDHREKKWILSRSVAVPRDSGGRSGIYFAHSLILDDPNDLGCLPIQFWNWDDWAKETGRQQDLGSLGTPLTPEAPLDLVSCLKSLRQDQEHPFDPKLAGELVGDFVKHRAAPHKHRILLLGESSDQVAAWVGVLCLCLPELFARQFTFSTYEGQERADIFLCGTLKGTSKVPADHRVIDLASKRAAAGRDLSAWSRFCVKCLEDNEREEDVVKALSRGKELFRLLSRDRNDAHLAIALSEAAELASGKPQSLTVQKVLKIAQNLTHSGKREDATELLSRIQLNLWPGSEMATDAGNPPSQELLELWLDKTSELLKTPDPPARDLRRQFLKILSDYAANPQSVEYIKRLDPSKFNAEEKEVLFDFFRKVLAKSKVAQFLSSLEESARWLAHIEKLVQEVDVADTLGNLVREKGFSTQWSERPGKLRESVVEGIGQLIAQAALMGNEGSPGISNLRTFLESLLKVSDRAQDGKIDTSVTPAHEEASHAQQAREVGGLPLGEKAADKVVSGALDPAEKEEVTFTSVEPTEGTSSNFMQNPQSMGTDAVMPDFDDRDFLARLCRATGGGEAHDLARKLIEEAEQRLPKGDSASHLDWFDAFFWPLWHAEQGRELLGKEHRQVTEWVQEKWRGLPPRQGQRVERMLRETGRSMGEEKPPLGPLK